MRPPRGEYRCIWEDWVGDWKQALGSKAWGMDLIAGLTVAAVALPLNLALAVACGLPPSAGLISGAIGGAVAASFGGAPLQVTGPAAALNTMVLLIVQEYGAAGAAAAALLTGVMALALGFTLAGKLARFVPEAVLTGFTTGVGIKLLDGQIPELLGFDYTVFHLATMAHRPQWLDEVSWLSVACGLLVAVLVALTRSFKRFPGALVGIGIVTALSVSLAWEVQRVGELPSTLPSPAAPSLTAEQWRSLVVQCIPLALLGAVESLLSARAVDRISRARKPHNPNLELIGQGLANVAVGFVGGLPVTGVIVRSSTNVQSGGRTRIAALTHGVILLLAALYLGTLLSRIPLSALAGLLCVIGWRLIDLSMFVRLLRNHRVDALAFAVTLAGTVSNRLMEGLAAGLLICGIQWLWARRTRAGRGGPDSHQGSLS